MLPHDQQSKLCSMGLGVLSKTWTCRGTFLIASESLPANKWPGSFLLRSISCSCQIFSVRSAHSPRVLSDMYSPVEYLTAVSFPSSASLSRQVRVDNGNTSGGRYNHCGAMRLRTNQFCFCAALRRDFRCSVQTAALEHFCRGVLFPERITGQSTGEHRLD